MNSNTINTWHQIVVDKNVAKLNELLDENVVFHSPVVHTPQVGKKITSQYLRAALHVFFNDSFTYVREIENENNAMLEFTVEIDGIIVNGVDMIQWNNEGRITEFKIMIRPLKAVHLIHQKMGELLIALKNN